jgi:hypothetical protein
MKKTFVLSTLLALALAACFAFVSCDTGTTDGSTATPQTVAYFGEH